MVNVNVNINVKLESLPRVPKKMDRCRWLSYYVHVYWGDFLFRELRFNRRLSRMEDWKKKCENPDFYFVKIDKNSNSDCSKISKIKYKTVLY